MKWFDIIKNPKYTKRKLPDDNGMEYSERDKRIRDWKNFSEGHSLNPGKMFSYEDVPNLVFRNFLKTLKIDPMEFIKKYQTRKRLSSTTGKPISRPDINPKYFFIKDIFTENFKPGKVWVEINLNDKLEFEKGDISVQNQYTEIPFTQESYRAIINQIIENIKVVAGTDIYLNDGLVGIKERIQIYIPKKVDDSYLETLVRQMKKELGEGYKPKYAKLLFIMYFKRLVTPKGSRYKQFKILNQKFPNLKNIYDSIDLNGYVEHKIDEYFEKYELLKKYKDNKGYWREF